MNKGPLQVKDYVKITILFLLFGVAWSLGIIMATVNLKYAPATTSVFIQFLAASIFMILFFRRSGHKATRDMEEDFRRNPTITSDLIFLVVSALSFCLASFFMVIKRYAYAPSGSDIIFLLTTAPLFAIILAALLKIDRLTWGKLAGSATALLGVIAIVANWEKPSSFSPLSVFFFEEMVFLLAAFSFAIFVVSAKKLVQRHSPNALASIILWMGSFIMFVLFLIEDGPAAITRISLDGWVILVVSAILTLVVPLWLLLDLLAVTSVPCASTAIFLSPLIITLMISIERGFGLAIMPTPFVWTPMIVGSMIILLGMIAVWVG